MISAYEEAEVSLLYRTYNLKNRRLVYWKSQSQGCCFILKVPVPNIITVCLLRRGMEGRSGFMFIRFQGILRLMWGTIITTPERRNPPPAAFPMSTVIMWKHPLMISMFIIFKGRRDRPFLCREAGITTIFRVTRPLTAESRIRIGTEAGQGTRRSKADPLYFNDLPQAPGSRRWVMLTHQAKIDKVKLISFGIKFDINGPDRPLFRRFAIWIGQKV